MLESHSNNSNSDAQWFAAKYASMQPRVPENSLWQRIVDDLLYEIDLYLGFYASK